MNRILSIFCGLLIIGSVALAFYLRSNDSALRETEIFLDNIRRGNLELAYMTLSDPLQKLASKEDLKRFVEINNLKTVRENRLEIVDRNPVGRHLAMLTRDTDTAEAAIHFLLSKQPQGWRLDYMTRSDNTILAPGTPLLPAVPESAHLVSLTGNTVQQFARSINARSMAIFYDHIANFWQQQSTLSELDEAYGTFFDAGLDLTVLAAIDPVIETSQGPDAIGVLTVNGFYPTAPSKMFFEQKYIYEGLGWKLVGFSANVR